jgi:hypothetical protein
MQREGGPAEVDVSLGLFGSKNMTGSSEAMASWIIQ